LRDELSALAAIVLEATGTIAATAPAADDRSTARRVTFVI
jgi:hypothetical protein